MQTTRHYDERAVSRGYGANYWRLVELYGDYIEQKSGSYVLTLDEPAAHLLKENLTDQERENLHRRKLTHRKIKNSALCLVEETQEGLDEEFRDLKREARYLKKMRKTAKPGHVVFGRESTESEVRAITVARTYECIKGYNRITE
jgi:hypothetical protein